MPDSGDHPSPHRICPVCHLGHTRPRAVTHVEWHDDQLIVVPDVGAEVCDFCGAVSPADDRLWRLDQLLRHGHALRSAPQRRPHHQSSRST